MTFSSMLPLVRAACTTFARPNAKPISATKRGRRTGTSAFPAPEFRVLSAASSLRLPSSDPSRASISRATSPLPIAVRTFSKPRTRAPALRASPRAPAARFARSASTSSASPSGTSTFFPRGLRKKAFADRRFQRLPASGNPDTPSRQSFAEIGNRGALRPDHEADEAFLRPTSPVTMQRRSSAFLASAFIVTIRLESPAPSRRPEPGCRRHDRPRGRPRSCPRR